MMLEFMIFVLVWGMVLALVQVVLLRQSWETCLDGWIAGSLWLALVFQVSSVLQRFHVPWLVSWLLQVALIVAIVWCDLPRVIGRIRLICVQAWQQHKLRRGYLRYDNLSLDELQTLQDGVVRMATAEDLRMGSTMDMLLADLRQAETRRLVAPSSSPSFLSHVS